MQTPTTLRTASASGAARRGCSSFWSFDAAAAALPTLPPPPPLPPAHPPPTMDWQQRALAIPIPRSRTLITTDPLATQAATNRIALNTKVGPHRGPGSGTLLAAHISKMKGQFERLDHWRDDSDTDKESDDD
jgi:hypothetical protein